MKYDGTYCLSDLSYMLRVFAEGEQNIFFSTKDGFQCSFVHRFRIYVPNRPTHPLMVAGLRLMFEKTRQFMILI